MIASRVLVVTGAPGAGKTAIVAHVAARLPNFIVLDMDALLAPASRLAGSDLRRPESALMWPSYNELWVRLAAMLASARPVLLLGPVAPSEIDAAPSRRTLGEVEWALLDCSDDTRRERLTARGYDSAAIDQAIADAAATRSLGLYAISSDGQTATHTATEVANWATHITP